MGRRIKTIQGAAVRRILDDPETTLRTFPLGDQHHVLADGRVMMLLWEDESIAPLQAVLWPSVEAVERNEKEMLADREKPPPASNHILWPALSDGRAFVRDHLLLRDQAVKAFRLGVWGGTEEDLDRLQASINRWSYKRRLSPERFPLILALFADAVIRKTGGELAAYPFSDDIVWEPYVVDRDKRLYWNPWCFLSSWIDPDGRMPFSSWLDFEIHRTRSLDQLENPQEDFAFRIVFVSGRNQEEAA